MNTQHIFNDKIENFPKTSINNKYLLSGAVKRFPRDSKMSLN